MGGPELSVPSLVSVETEGGVALLALNRPDALNALNRAVMRDLAQALDVLKADPHIHAAVLTGGPRVFAAGADIREFDGAPVLDPAREEHLGRFDLLGEWPKPIIAAVSGFALGGGMELALACDMIVASETAVFGQPEINLGVIPGAGGTQRLARIVGRQRAMELVLTGKRIDARQALRWGLVNAVHPVESFLAEARKLAAEIASKPPVAAAMAKQAILAASNLELKAGLAYERGLFNSLFATEDQKEGVRAFLEKRRPLWKGK